jgi:very-short-patch-repair endonuclease
MYYRVKQGRCQHPKCKRKGKKATAKWNINGILRCHRCANAWFSHGEVSKPEDKRGLAVKRAKQLRENATESELVFKYKLDKTEWQFKFQKIFARKNMFAIVDFYIPHKKLCIEIDGGYHNKREQKRKDNWRDSWLRKRRGVTVMRLTNEDATEMSVDSINRMIEEA